jgi:NADH:ubiquinone oxidoreductase subunit 6 (subunit J)
MTILAIYQAGVVVALMLFAHGLWGSTKKMKEKGLDFVLMLLICTAVGAILSLLSWVTVITTLILKLNHIDKEPK